MPFYSKRSLNTLVKSEQIEDRDCVLQDEISSTAPRSKSHTKDAISLFHKSGRPDPENGPPKQLPSPDEVFKNLLESKGDVVHPNGISSLAYAFASLVNLSIRRPESSDPSISSYFDLYPLYGGESSEFDQVRLKDGRGMLSPDCFFDDRLAFLPRASSVLLILFNRNHNYIARRLLLHTENRVDGVVSTDAILSPSLSQQDDDIFKKARLINCGHFRNIMLEDLLKPLMGLSAIGPSHDFDFLSQPEGASLSLGKGFNGFVESALLYDWSDIMSEQDVQQFENEISQQDFDDATEGFTSGMNKNKRNRHCAGLQRGEDERFHDPDLAKILQAATECPARATGQGIPSCQRIMQIKALEWSRNLKACSLNDYRKFLGLKGLQSFQEWTSNQALAESAEALYKSIDNLEVYVGLQMEDTIKDSKDSGFRFGYTKTYGLLVDIVSRIRSDPSLVSDFTPECLTEWGLQDCKPRPTNGAFGASMPKLLQRTLPHEYAYNNIYGLFPLTVPDHTRRRLNELGLKSKYDVERPQPRKVHNLVTREAVSHVFNEPALFPTAYNDNLVALTGGYGYFLGFDDEKRHDQDQIMSLHALIPDAGALRRYAESFSNMANECIRENAVWRQGTDVAELDVARDVINAVCTRWVSETLLEYPLKQAGEGEKTGLINNSNPLLRYILYPLWARFNKIEAIRRIASTVGEHQKQGTTAPALPVSELSDKFASIYAFVFQHVDSEDGWVLRETALRTSAVLSEHIRNKLPAAGVISDQSYIGSLKESFEELRTMLSHIFEEFTTGTTLPEQTAQSFLSRVVNANESIPPHAGDENQQSASQTILAGKVGGEDQEKSARIVANVLGLAVVASVKYAQVCTQAVNFYFQEEYTEERKEIIRLSRLNDANSKKLLMGYIREAYRLDHPLGIWRQVRVPKTTVIQQGSGLPGIRVDSGDIIYADFSKILRDPTDVSNPLKVDPNRKVRAMQGLGLHSCPGFSFVDETMPEIFKAIFRKENIRRTPGRRGNIVRFTARPDLQDASPNLFLNTVPQAPDADPKHTSFRLGSYPQSLVLEFDEKKAEATESIAQKRKKWKIDPGKTTEKMRVIMDRAMSVIVISVIVWTIFTMINSIVSFFSSSPRSRTANRPPVASPSPRPPPPPATPMDGCPLPTSEINPWETITMKVGENGELIPLEYTLDLPTAHRLSFVDIDAKDMRMKLWLDTTLLGFTPEVELNRSETCGEDYADCLDRKFSGGDIVLPKGNHTVRIEWAGVETPGPDGKIDWGEEAGRRLGWSRMSCGA